jgi:SAM-dependent methyltransferase
MQTPAERHLIRRLTDSLSKAAAGSGTPLLLNIGAGRSTQIEEALIASGCRFVCDRMDVEACAADLPVVGRCLQCSVEDMKTIESGVYEAAFANYVLEHVGDPARAGLEIFRVLKPEGIFVTTVPNLTAPEFFVARHAPAGLQRVMTRGRGFHTCYAWGTIGDLAARFERSGLVVDEVKYWAFTEGYLGRYAVAGHLSRVYDRIVSGIGLKRLMGNVCITFRKP